MNLLEANSYCRLGEVKKPRSVSASINFLLVGLATLSVLVLLTLELETVLKLTCMSIAVF